jgi:hypothetical protein
MVGSMRRRVVSAVLAVAALSVVPVSAATIQLTASDSGFYDSAGNHTAQNQNYLTGRFDGSERRSFFVFDLASVSGTVTAATLNLYNPDVSPTLKGYVSPDPTESLSVFDVSTPLSTLTLGGVGIAGVFDDLGTGLEVGSVMVSPADNGQTVAIVFNANGLAALNAGLGGTIAFGSAITTLSGSAGNEFVFGFSTVSFAGGDVRRLDLTVVPEPTTLALFVLVLGTTGLRHLRRPRH